MTVNKPLVSGYASPRMGRILISLNVLIGSLYILIQWVKGETVFDGIFVSILIMATMILIEGIRNVFRYSLHHGLDFFSCIKSKQPQVDFADFIDSVYHTRRMTLVGVLYGMLLGLSPLILGVWGQDAILASVLSTFLFSINFVTGVAFYSLVNFFIFSLKMGKQIEVDLWQRENPATAFLFGIGKRISILSSIYITLCISSITFSIMPVGAFTIAYSIFACCVIISCLIIPLLPIIQKLQAVKRKALIDINNKLQIEFQRIFTNPTTDDSYDLKKIESLLLLHDRIESIHILPYRMKVIRSVVSILLVSSIPALLELYLEYLIK